MDFFAFAPRVFNFSVLPIIFPAPWIIYSSRRHRSFCTLPSWLPIASGVASRGCRYVSRRIIGRYAKRAGLARAITAEPKIIFFDEPTTGLDPIMSGVINKLIRELVTELGVTAITITHDMSSVRMIADSVTMLHAGAVQWSGGVADLENSGSAHLEQFLSGSAEGPIESVR